MSLFNPEELKRTFRKIEKEVYEWVTPPAQPKTPFEVSQNFDNQTFYFETTDPTEFTILLFSRLSSFYEKGFLFEKKKNDTTPTDMDHPWLCSLSFNEGKIFFIDPPLAVEFPLPPVNLNKISFSKPAHWNLRSPEWKQLLPSDSRWTALSFSLNDHLQMVLLTCLAEPWLHDHVEKTHRFLNLALMEQP